MYTSTQDSKISVRTKRMKNSSCFLCNTAWRLSIPSTKFLPHLLSTIQPQLNTSQVPRLLDSFAPHLSCLFLSPNICQNYSTPRDRNSHNFCSCLFLPSYKCCSIFIIFYFSIPFLPFLRMDGQSTQFACLVCPHDV